MHEHPAPAGLRTSDQHHRQHEDARQRLHGSVEPHYSCAVVYRSSTATGSLLFMQSPRQIALLRSSQRPNVEDWKLRPSLTCAVLGTITVAPISRPKDCATNCTSITVAQFTKKPPAVRLSVKTRG